MTEERLLTVREVAGRCHRSEETIRRWIWSGKLPARKLGNQLFVEEGELGRVQLEWRVSEPKAEYRASAGNRGHSARRKYSPVIEDMREHRGPLLPTREEALRHIQEDEAFQDELLAKYGPVDVVGLLRQVREE